MLGDNEASTRLAPGEPSILFLFNEYKDSDGAAQSPSRWLMELRNYGRLGKFNPAFPIHTHLVIAEFEKAIPPQQ